MSTPGFISGVGWVQYPCGAKPEADQPRGYLEWFEWVKRKARTHHQKQCKQCGLWHVWIAKGSREPEERSAAPGHCIVGRMTGK